MTDRNTLEIANFTCAFGGKPMVTLLDEVVRPAFFDETLVRKYRDSEFLFINVGDSVFNIGKGEYRAIYGRFVQKRMLVSEQGYIDGKLVKRIESIKDAPSSVFALDVDSHRLLIAGETPYAPGIGKFASTIRRFLYFKLQDYVVEYSKQKKISISSSRSDLGEVFLNVVPLPSHKDIDDYIDQFKTIQRIKIRLIKHTNHERDAGIWADDLRTETSPMKPNAVDIDVRKSDGIESGAAKNYVHPIAAKAHSKIVFSGITENGQKITGDTSEFRLRAPVSLSGDLIASVRNMLSVYAESLGSGLILPD